MVVWSSISRSLVGTALQLSSKANRSSATTKNVIQNAVAIQTREMSGHGPKIFYITPSRFQWHKFKDSLHYFVMVGLIPITGVLLYTNIFIGPATLAPVPEGYVPKHWEYHRHPVTRFLSRYLYPSPQQDYEKMCHFLHEEQERMALRKLEKQVKEKMAERNDYQAYYYRPASAKYIRVSKHQSEYIKSILGD